MLHFSAMLEFTSLCAIEPLQALQVILFFSTVLKTFPDWSSTVILTLFPILQQLLMPIKIQTGGNNHLTISHLRL